MNQENTESLEYRISSAIEADTYEKDFSKNDWLVLALSGAVIPTILLIWGWY
tara:strand:+ start:3294 stop:3449 length:156 start_codon:yes stop_codon:yes gene_type:complete